VAVKRTSSGIPIATPLAVLAVVVATAVALLFPLTGTPGPEAAQILSVVGGPALFVAAAARGAHRHERGYVADLLVQLIVVVVVFFGFMAAIGLGALGRETCAPDRGFIPFFILALPVLLLSSTCGLFVGRSIPSTRLAVIAAFVILAANVAWSVVDWFLEPGFRVLTHFFVAIPGDMLAGQALVGGQVAFRFATFLFALAFAFAGAALHPAARRGGGLASGQKSGPWALVLSLSLFGIAFVVDKTGSQRIGSSRSDLDDDYVLSRTRGQLTVRADPRQLSVRDVDAMLAEGTLWLDRLRDRLGVAPSSPITIWLHADANAMSRYTGARNVHFALPFKRELHISTTVVPHPSLGHELVHVLGVELSDTLLGVPSRLPLLMHAGIVEGTAMALTPELEVRDGLTLREQAAALRRANLAPPLDVLFDDTTSLLGFWRHAPGRAYVTAGALIEALLAEKGVAGIAAVYRAGSLSAAFSDDEERARFIAAHEGALERMELPADAIFSVKQSFARPSILDETCDREKMERAVEVRSAARLGELERAEKLAFVAEDGSVTSATYAALADEARVLDEHEAAMRFLSLATTASDSSDPRVSASRLQALGDAQWLAGDRHEAIATWERIDTATLAPYPARLVEARRLLGTAARARAGQSALAEAALRFIVRGVGDADDAARLARFVGRLAEIRDVSSTDASLIAFCRYLVGRQAIQRGALDDGLDLMLLAVEKEHISVVFREEALRALAVAHARRGDHDVAFAGFEKLADVATRPATRLELRDRAERVKRAALAKSLPRTDVKAGDRHLLGIGEAGGI
jgi:tetratricopeptide (TPR) repeat protein